ncbi:protein of unknown function [Roseateles sp. YR242]|uniref:DUF4926 domain-containing protein n=1 Tax=Roseateles sp. YR242 TaxID=1855305 RepID=UPI0008C16CBA|nr:DUF4926 domain-containing protein [Roseateles sp. YR242]SEL32835.1 protein of unknown function [Roseateles sp. YR242]
MKPKINDVVQLTALPPDDLVTPGMLGVIVAAFSEPEEAYEVEFSNNQGETIAQVVLRPKQFVIVRG